MTKPSTCTRCGTMLAGWQVRRIYERGIIGVHRPVLRDFCRHCVETISRLHAVGHSWTEMQQCSPGTGNQD